MLRQRFLAIGELATNILGLHLRYALRNDGCGMRTGVIRPALAAERAKKSVEHCAELL